MFNIILAPFQAIKEAGSKKSMSRTMKVLLVASLFAGLSALLVTKSFTGLSLLIALGIAVGMFVCVLVMSFFFKLSLHMLSKKGGYYEALTAVTYGCFVFACGALATSVLSLLIDINVVLNVIVALVSVVIMLAAIILAKTIKLRAAMDFFSADLLTVIVAFVIVYVSVLFAFYFLVRNSCLGLLDLLTHPCSVQI
ncbi:hypothetical protein KJ742_00760 [Patescibacteria group bacterium]|nr:hypothetical protein [Patescibacteria group bacterium]MBU1682453.1 hypothetical protein [Patescibacteria group bacterium]